MKLKSRVSTLLSISFSLWLIKPTIGLSQTHKIDSLKKVLAVSKEDTTIINLTNGIATLLYSTGMSDSALANTDRSARLSQKLDFKKGLSESYKITGQV